VDEERGRPSLATVRHEHHNEVYTLSAVRPHRVSVVAIAYSFLVGSTAAPGLALLPRALLRADVRDVALRFYAANRGRLEGVVTAMRAARRARSGTATTPNRASMARRMR
jgi:hypothetical protein